MFKRKLKNAISNITLTGIVLAVVLLIVALLFPLFQILVFSAMAENHQQNLHYMYEYSSDYNFFCENSEEFETSNNVLNDAFDVIPEPLSTLIKNEWSVVVSNEPPYKHNARFAVAGVTYQTEKIIWIETGSEIEVYIHEFGHAFDEILGQPSRSKIFQAIYQNNWDTYIEFNKTEIDTHSVSDEAEFFAALFVDYCLHPEYLEENLYEGYQYFERITKNTFSLTGFGRYLSRDLALIRLLSDVLNIHKPYKKLDYVIKDVEKSVSNNDYVAVEEYDTVVDYEWMIDKSEFFIDIMFDILNNPDKYPDNKEGSNNYVIKVDEVLTFRQYTELLNFAVIYFGDETVDPIDFNVVNNEYTEITFKKDLILEYQTFREKSLERVDWTLENCIREGTETEMLIQISKFIINHATYKENQNTSTDTFWVDRTGDCVTYAMIFKQFANRIGIECDVVFVETSLGNQHMYNRVKLSDGTYRYYDLTREIVDDDQIDRSGFHINQFVTMQQSVNFYSRLR